MFGEDYDVFEISAKGQHIKANVQYQLIKDIKAGQPCNLERADFRSTKIQDCQFKDATFFNSDFKGAVVQDTRFEGCNFRATDILNTTFVNVHFVGADFADAALKHCQFTNCTFTGSFYGASIDHCTFIDSTLDGVSFQASSLLDLRFVRCELKGLDTSNAGSSYLFFDHCQLSEMTMEVDDLPTFFFKPDYPLDRIKMRYRGDHVTFDRAWKKLDEFMSRLLKTNRFTDTLNLHILYRRHYDKSPSRSLEPWFKSIMEKLLAMDHDLDRESQLLHLADLVDFYAGSDVLSGNDESDMITTLLTFKLPEESQASILFHGRMLRLRDRFVRTGNGDTTEQ